MKLLAGRIVWGIVLWALLAFAPRPANGQGQYEGWGRSGVMTILTTPDGADLPAAASVEGFPLLVRLHGDFFDFREVKANGEDIRFSTLVGERLAYQIEQWDAAGGVASIWVRIPRVEGNARQEIRIHWGKADAASESDGSAVFNASNGYASVWHMGEGAAKDELGTLQSKDIGPTTAMPGMIGMARRFAGRQGIFGGDKIPDYPSGASAHSTEAWVWAERPNVTILGWGNEGGGRGSKVRMQLRSPPHLHIDSDFSDVKGAGPVAMGRWMHVMHTYDGREGRVYVDGKLDGSATPALNIKSPARLWIGGWYDNYDFVGAIDEVRVSRVARPAEWVKLQHENQKAMQTAVGHVVRAGDGFSVAPAELTVKEGQSATVVAEAGGAVKVYWIFKRDGRETIVATDRFKHAFDAGRVSGDQRATLVFKAVYADGVKTREVPITIRETAPDPVYALRGPATWDGREAVEVVADVANAKDAGAVEYEWSVAGIATIKEARAGKLVLTRAQNSGRMTVTATARNGGEAVRRSIEVVVKEPDRDAWVARIPGKEERPEDGQFYARDNQGEGTLFYNGKLGVATDGVFLKLYADDKLVAAELGKGTADGAYALAVKLKPGLVRYRVEFGSVAGGRETVLHAAKDLVCGDVFLINGQSNAEATAWGKEEYAFTSPWIRSFGSAGGGDRSARGKQWAEAVARGRGGEAQVGLWGMELARRLVEKHGVPVCIINGAVGGTRIDQHQRNPADPEDARTIYGRLLWRVREAGLTHGVRGIFWHQGENDQGADGPSGGFGHEAYRELFIEMAAGWKRDYPNVRQYYVFQIWPRACSMGVDASDDRLREVQRQLPTAFARMSVMSTLGVEPAGTCHYTPAGYAKIADLICPLVERDFYGAKFDRPITAANLLRASVAGEEIALEFDQAMTWDDSLAGQFFVDGEKGRVVSGRAEGNFVKLKLAGAVNPRRLTYLDGRSWRPGNVLRGANGIAALTFCDVPVAAAR